MVPWPQEGLANAFFSCFPCGLFEGVQFPFIEDLANSGTFTDFFAWANDHDIDVHSSAMASLNWDIPAQMHLQRGWQPGAFESRYAPESLVAPFLTKQEHFEEAQLFPKSVVAAFLRRLLF